MLVVCWGVVVVIGKSKSVFANRWNVAFGRYGPPYIFLLTVLLVTKSPPLPTIPLPPPPPRRRRRRRNRFPCRECCVHWGFSSPSEGSFHAKAALAVGRLVAVLAALALLFCSVGPPRRDSQRRDNTNKPQGTPDGNTSALSIHVLSEFYTLRNTGPKGCFAMHRNRFPGSALANTKNQHSSSI